ncbi:MAG: VIT1/CCC1 transporter family protein [Patescibacteria group bacterium]
MKHTHRLSSPNIAYLRNFVFGVEDSLVSTVGLLSGVAIAGVAEETIILTGIVLIFVEAVSMAAGTFLSEYAAEEYEQKREVSEGPSLKNGAVMFVSYFVSGFLPLIPYMLFETAVAFWVSIGVSLIALFLLGVLGAKVAHVNLMRNALRMLFVGGLAITVGVLVGRFFGN